MELVKRSPLPPPRKPMKRAQMRQGSSIPAAPRKPLPAQSPGRRAQASERKAVIAQTRERAGDHCEALALLPYIACRPPMDCHERLSRARSGGKSQLDASLTAWVCRAHHDHLTTNPAEAESLGLSLPSRPASRLLIELEDT